MEMYNCVETTVTMEDRRSEWFEVKVGVHRGSFLSPLLFAVVLDEITKDIREGIPKQCLYADTWCFLETVGLRLKGGILSGRERFKSNQFIIGEITVEQYHQIEKTKQKQTTREKKIYTYIFYKQILCSEVRKKEAQNATVIPRETAK